MDKKNAKKKYTLYNSNDNRPNSEKPCAFFFSDAGCRNGEKCAFSHTASDNVSVSDISEAPEVQSSKPKPRSASITSVESDRTGNKKAKKEKKEKKRKQVDDSAAVAQQQHHQQAPSSNGNNGSIGNGDTDQIKWMQERMQQMEQQLAAAQAAPSSSNKSAKKEKNSTPGSGAKQQQQQQGGMMMMHQHQLGGGSSGNGGVMATPYHGFPVPTAESTMSVASVGGPPPGLGMNNMGALGGMNMGMGMGMGMNNLNSSSVMRPKSNFLSPTAAAAGGGGGMMSVSTSTKKKNKRREEDEDTAFLFGAVNTVINPVFGAGANAGQQQQQQGLHANFKVNKNLGATAFADGSNGSMGMGSATEASAQSSSSSSSPKKGGGCDATKVEEALGFSATATEASGSTFPFLEKANVMKTLQTSGTDHATGKSATGPSAKTMKILELMQKADPQQLPWGTLIQKTHASIRFKKDYGFDNADHSWVHPRPYGEWCANMPPVLAIDCEMCQTTDPVTKERDNNALIRFSIVNGLNPSEVLFDQLVKPLYPISDSRAHIHGIPEESLEGITFTLRHAQAALMQICSDHTIIVGHSVHNDLKALRVVHRNCIDTSYLYSVENEPGASPSMRDVSEHILGTKLPDLHDSVLDARAANQAAMFLLVQGCPETAPECPRTGGNGAGNLSSQLLAHRLPLTCTTEHLLALILKYTRVLPENVSAVQGGAPGDDTPKGKATITFSSKEHADLAFESIPGPNRPDKSNKAQKRIYLKGSGGYINLRKQV
jgi:DNA polymerase III epsilon subunit-like protein